MQTHRATLNHSPSSWQRPAGSTGPSSPTPPVRLQLNRLYTHTHTHGHRHKHEHPHTYTTKPHTYTHTHTHGHRHRHGHAHTYTHRPTDLYTHTQTHTHINTYTFLNYIFFSIYLICFIPSHILLSKRKKNNVFLSSLQPWRLQYYRRGLQFSCISTEIKPLTHESAGAGRE